MIDFNKFINKVGMDKVLHFAVGSLLTSLMVLSVFFYLHGVSLIVAIAPIIGTLVTTGLSIIKELYIDNYVDKKDILASAYGGILIIFITLSVYLVKLIC